MKIQLIKEDCWIGLFWKHDYFMSPVEPGNLPQVIRRTTWHLCLLPCLPLVWSTRKVVRLSTSYAQKHRIVLNPAQEYRP